MYTSPHGIYISKFEKALQGRTPFEHKTCKECTFGQRFKKNLGRDSSKIDTCNPADGYEEDLQHARNLSTQLTSS